MSIYAPILNRLLASSMMLALGFGLLVPTALATDGDPTSEMAPVFSGSVSDVGQGFTDDVDKAEADMQADPNDPEKHFLLGVAYSRTPYLERAIEELQRSRRLAKKTKEGMSIFDRKIGEYEKMLAADPENPQLLYRMGFGYYFRGLGMEWGYITDKSTTPEAWYGKAQESLRHLLTITPDDTAARNYLGYFLVEKDNKANVKEAVDLWESVLKLEPDNPGAHMLLGQYYMKTGNLRKAVEFSTKGLKLRNEWLAAHNIAPDKLFGRY